MRIFELMYFTHGNVPEAAYSLGLGLILYASVTIPRLNFLSLVCVNAYASLLILICVGMWVWLYFFCLNGICYI